MGVHGERYRHPHWVVRVPEVLHDPGRQWPVWVDNDNAALAGTFLPILLMVGVSLCTKRPRHFVDYGQRLRAMEAEERAARAVASGAPVAVDGAPSRDLLDKLSDGRTVGFFVYILAGLLVPRRPSCPSTALTGSS